MNLERSLIQRVNVGDLLTRSAARKPGQTAIIDGTRRFSYAEFNAWANRVAHGLAALGYGPGDALALMSDNRAEFLVTYFACARLGVVCVPLNLFWRGGELAYVLEHAQVKGAVVTRELLPQLLSGLRSPGSPGGAAALRELVVIDDGSDDGSDHGGDPEALPAGLRASTFDALHRGKPEHEPAALVDDRAPLSYLYTSGTTSAPKGVVGSHLAIYLESLGTAIDTRMSDADRVLAMMPMFHTAQLNAICTPAIAVGATLCVMKKFDAQTLLDTIERESLSVLFGLPMMYRALLEAQRQGPRNVSSLRLAVYAMAPMPDHELRAAIETFGCGFSLMFGQTEMSPVASFFRPEHQLTHPGSAGTPGINVQAAIMDGNGKLLPQGEAGEIVYRSPQALSGYLHNEEATEEAFRHGWFHSGDVGHFDEDGLLWFHDRYKDVIKSGGENIASIEVEKALYEIEPDIAEVVVIGLPHAHWTEAVTAVIVPRPGARIDDADLLARARQRLSPYKCPKAVITVDALQKTPTGKVQKAVLRKLYAGYYADSATTTAGAGPASR